VVVDGANVYSYVSGAWVSTGFGTLPTSNPIAAAFDSAGNLFVSDGGNSNIYKCTGGTWTTTTVPNASNFNSLATDGSGKLFGSYSYIAQLHYVSFTLPGVVLGTPVTNANARAVASYGTDVWVALGNAITRVQGAVGTINVANMPISMAFTSAAGGYYTDSSAVYTTGNVNIGFPGVVPNHVASDASGNLYVTDIGAATVHKYNGSSWTTLAGYPGAVPYGIAVH